MIARARRAWAPSPHRSRNSPLTVLRRFRIQGESMRPTLRHGQRVWACPWPYRWLRPGMLVLARHPVYGLLAKRLEDHTPEHFVLSSDNAAAETLGCDKALPPAAYVGRILLRSTRSSAATRPDQP
ncbi:MAG: S24/S26 family peptidase [Pseudomonadota bacterium]